MPCASFDEIRSRLNSCHDKFVFLTFVFLIIDTIPDYMYTAAMPADGQSALWKYKGIYLQSDARVGQWSDVVSIPVAG